MTNEENGLKLIRAHYEGIWRVTGEKCAWRVGRWREIHPEFSILRFSPAKHQMWAYGTCGMSLQTDSNQVELHLFSPYETDHHAELLTSIAHYHATAAYIDVGHTVNFGRPWIPGSSCDHGLVSLPYLDGPELERLPLGTRDIRFLWLIPITPQEVEFCREKGPEALEERFELAAFNYLDPARRSVV